MSAAPVFTWPVRVYWEDTDAGGIVFYANYLKFFERARTEWLRALGVEQSTLRETIGGMFIVSETTVRYLAPARLDDELLVTAGLEAAGRASLIIAQQVINVNNRDRVLSAAGPPQGANAPSGGSAVHEVTSVGAHVLCAGTIRIGWVDAATLRPARIPDAILEVLKNC